MGSEIVTSDRKEEDCSCRCDGLCAFRVLDTLALIAAVGVQGAAFNNFFINYHPDEQRWYLLFSADVLMIIVALTASVLSYRKLLARLHSRLARVDIPHVTVPMYGVLPFGYVTWALYAALLTAKIALFFSSGVALALTADDSASPFLNTTAVKITIASASVVFILLVNTHHDAEPQSLRSAYIADLCKGTTFDIMDSVAFLTILLPPESLAAASAEGDDRLPPELTDAIVGLACVNLFLPTLALMKLSLSDFGQANQPVRLELLYKTGRLLLIDLPYMVVRLYIYVWRVDRSISLFLMKNVLYVMVSLRYLVPEYIAVARSRRRSGRVGAAEEGEEETSPTAPPMITDGVV